VLMLNWFLIIWCALLKIRAKCFKVRYENKRKAAFTETVLIAL